MAQKHERWGFTLNAGVIEATDQYIADHQGSGVDEGIAGNAVLIFQLHQ